VRDAVALGYIERHPRDAARSLSSLPEQDFVEVISSLTPRLAALLLCHSEPSAATRCLSRLRVSLAARIVAHLPVDFSAERLRNLPADRRRELLAALPRTRAPHLRVLLRYAEGSIGAVLDTDVLTLPQDIRVGEAVRLARRSAHPVENSLCVLDAAFRLKGMVDVCRLLAEKDRTPLSRIMEPAPVVLYARAGLHTVEAHEAWVRHETLPVVNRQNVFQGVLRRTSVLRDDAALLPELADHRELATTQRALADVFWLAVTGLFAGGARSARQRRE
jgi:Mg/Co/Ni transporter MgtE